MIGSVGGGNNLFAYLQARTAKARTASGTPQNAKDAEASTALEEKRRKSDEVLRQLKHATDSMKHDRKAAAQQKVERLKRELENLRRFSGGDPKAIARQAARIARELGQAAKEYSSAGGGASMGVSGAGAAASSQQAGGQPADGGQAAAEQAAGTAESVAAIAEGEAGAEAEASVMTAAAQAEQVAADAEAEADDAAGDGDTAKDADDPTKPLSPEEQRTAFVEELNAKVSDMVRQSGEAEADKKFENEVRRLFAEAKSILEQQRRRAKAEKRDDAELDQFAKDVAQAGQAIDQAFSAGGMDLGFVTAQAAVNITV